MSELCPKGGAKDMQPATTTGPLGIQEVLTMKVRPSVKPMCEKCKVIKRKGKVMVDLARTPSISSRQGNWRCL